MSRKSTARALDVNPVNAINRWPVDVPLAALASGGLHPRWSRWSMFARPTCEIAVDPARPGDLANVLDRLPRRPDRPAADAGGFGPGWIIVAGYELGGLLEPAATQTPPPDDRQWPLLTCLRCDGAIIHDRITDSWSEAGPGTGELLAALAEPAPARPGPRIGVTTPSLDDDAHEAAVRRAIDYIAAGDIFQANITRRWSGPFSGCARTFASSVISETGAWYGACVETAAGTIVSASPELLVDVAPSGDGWEIRSRPIKGTTLRSRGAHELLSSEKDAAELAMIVDLMRNDIGRLAELGSVRVDDGRSIEAHGALLHGVGTVSGRLRPSTSTTAILRAVFPAGSITGAPKIRAMQVIEALENVARGPYCGAIGFAGDDGSLQLNVAIRTFAIRGERSGSAPGTIEGTIDYGAGGGIVADSNPAAERRESDAKAAPLIEARHRFGTTPATTR